MTNYRILCIAALMASVCSCKKESFGDRMVRETRENTAKLCPMEVDQDTMLDSMAFDKTTHTLYYYYSLHGFLDFDSLYSDDVVEAHRETLIKDIRNSVTLRDVKKEKANFKCVYLSASSGKVLLQYDIPAEEYGK